jgi:ferredoxin-NADP reductase
MVWIKLPYGEFVINPSAELVVLIAGGTGITPFISYLESAFYKDHGQSVIMYHGVQSIERLVYMDTLNQAKVRIPGFKMYLYVEDRSTEMDSATIGRLDIANIYNRTKKLGNSREYYLSGPPEMIADFKGYLLKNGIEEVHIDEWQ